MNSNPSTNFDQARNAVSGGVGMQSSYVAVPGASITTPASSMNFPDASAATAPQAPTPPPVETAAPLPQPPMASIPDVSMQAAIPPPQAPNFAYTPPPPFDANPSPYSSVTTPTPPPPPDPTFAPPPSLPSPALKKMLPKKWSLSRKLTVSLIVVLAGIALVIFIYSYFNRRTNPPSKRPDAAAATPVQPKYVVVHLAQGSSLQLQGLKDLVPQNGGGGDVASLKKDIATMQKTLESIDSTQKTWEGPCDNKDASRQDDMRQYDWGREDWRRDDSNMAKKRTGSGPGPDAPASAAPAGRLSKSVHYSADLAMQSRGSDRTPEENSNARWASGAPPRFYGDASGSHASALHFSEFSLPASHTEHV